MRSKANKHIILLSFMLLSGLLVCQTTINWFKIPAQTYNPYTFVNDTVHKLSYTVKEFSVSQQITFKEYKQYLEDMKRDSGLAFYKSQLPDSNMCLKEAYNKYISGKAFDNYPVLGISWEDALNYCKWRTLKDNKDSLVFLYRLPHLSEWAVASDYLAKQKIKTDFSKYYADWTLAAFDESAYDFEHDLNPADYEYFALPNEANVLKRKRIMGNSFKYQSNYALQNGYGYSFEGYAHVGFRLVKETITPQMRAQKPVLEKEYSKEQKKVILMPRPMNMLHYWGIYPK